MNAPMPIPMITSASRTLTTAMTINATFVVWRSFMMNSRLVGDPLVPAPAATRPRDLVQRLPALVGGRAGFLDCAPHAPDLADEIVELRLELRPEPLSARRQVQEAPGGPRGRANQRCHKDFRLVVHRSSLLLSAGARNRGPGRSVGDAVLLPLMN